MPADHDDPRPIWWGWELELSPHLLKRMIDRSFSEVDLRAMMESADYWREDDEPGRWALSVTHDGGRWEVIVEPDWADQVLVVITAYPVDRT
ncbi:MAG: DUF4258 domain-containing protein [Phycisphaeraceae bacterium]